MFNSLADIIKGNINILMISKFTLDRLNMKTNKETQEVIT